MMTVATTRLTRLTRISGTPGVIDDIGVRGVDLGGGSLTEYLAVDAGPQQAFLVDGSSSAPSRRVKAVGGRLSDGLLLDDIQELGRRPHVLVAHRVPRVQQQGARPRRSWAKHALDGFGDEPQLLDPVLCQETDPIDLRGHGMHVRGAHLHPRHGRSRAPLTTPSVHHRHQYVFPTLESCHNGLRAAPRHGSQIHARRAVRREVHPQSERSAHIHNDDAIRRGGHRGDKDPIGARTQPRHWPRGRIQPESPPLVHAHQLRAHRDDELCITHAANRRWRRHHLETAHVGGQTVVRVARPCFG